MLSRSATAKAIFGARSAPNPYHELCGSIGTEELEADLALRQGLVRAGLVAALHRIFHIMEAAPGLSDLANCWSAPYYAGPKKVLAPLLPEEAGPAKEHRSCA